MRNPFIRFEFDRDELIDAAYEFVIDPRASRNERPIVKALDDFNPEMVDILESMVIDGTEDRQDVADYVDAALPA